MEKDKRIERLTETLMEYFGKEAIRILNKTSGGRWQEYIHDETSEDKWRTDAHLEEDIYDYAGNIREDEGEETPLEHGERMESIRDSLREDGYESL